MEDKGHYIAPKQNKLFFENAAFFGFFLHNSFQNYSMMYNFYVIT